ncbi:MAG: hypothetical protein KDA21_15015 [Phycisphaerales bacterium]|nr:hypothetical protein [Phycisphaerales bacterium]
MSQLSSYRGSDSVVLSHPESSPLSLLPVERAEHILPEYRGTPIADLLAAHNLGRALTVPTPPANADLLIITCMDHRVTFDIPEYFAYQIRTAGATVSPILSNVAFAVGVAGVRSICVIGHTDCAMCRVENRTDTLVEALVENESMCPNEANAHATRLREVFRVEDPVRATWKAARQVAASFPSCLVAPLLYRVEDGALLQLAPATDRA